MTGTLVALALAFVLSPWARQRKVDSGMSHFQSNLLIHRDQLKQLQADHYNGILSAAEFESERAELGKRVLEDALATLKDDIPESYDMILVSNMLHGLGEDASRVLIRRLYKSVNHGGSLVIQAQFLRDDHLGGRWPVFLDLIQLCVTDNGRNHSPGETRRWLEEAGFKNIEFCGMTLLNTNSFLRGFKV